MIVMMKLEQVSRCVFLCHNGLNYFSPALLHAVYMKVSWEYKHGSEIMINGWLVFSKLVLAACDSWIYFIIYYLEFILLL